MYKKSTRLGVLYVIVYHAKRTPFRNVPFAVKVEVESKSMGFDKFSILILAYLK